VTEGLWCEERLLVDGRLVAAASGATYDDVNPATEEVIGVVADGGAVDMDAAVAAARRAFDETSWSTDLAFRVRCLRQLQEGLVRHADELRGTIVAEAGASLSLTMGAQQDTPVQAVGWVAETRRGAPRCSAGWWPRRPTSPPAWSTS